MAGPLNPLFDSSDADTPTWRLPDVSEEEFNRLALERPCGCPGDVDDPHLADCDGNRAPSKDDYLDYYGRFDHMDDVPDTEF